MQDGTLTDSIAAVEAAWTAKAEELGMDPAFVIAATHGRRASDNLQELIPSLKPHHVDQEVDSELSRAILVFSAIEKCQPGQFADMRIEFERSILAFADTPPRSRSGSVVSSRRSSTASSRKPSFTSVRRSSITPFGSAGLTPLSTTPSQSGRNSPTQAIPVLSSMSSLTREEQEAHGLEHDPDATPMPMEVDEDPFDVDEDDIIDMSVQILPGVRELIKSLPEDRYAVATSGAKTYCHGCLNRTGIKIPKVCVTADDSRLKRGKPFPDPFLLAASDLGMDPKRCVVFEDSPSGIKAGVASGATVIAVCTSHTRNKIDSHGAHYIVDTMDQVKVVHNHDGTLGFTVYH